MEDKMIEAVGEVGLILSIAQFPADISHPKPDFEEQVQLGIEPSAKTSP